jgi:predicted enzyme related to lactoylglutathione lyase
MKNYLGRIILLVDDYEKAAAFYEANFGFKRIFDVTTDVGQRFLHMGNEQDQSAIWFLQAEGKDQKERIGNQTAGQPTMVMYTDNLEEMHQRLLANNVKIKVPPVTTPEYSFLHCYDVFGNEIIVTELK